MSSALVPTITLELDKPRKARLDINAMIDFERVTGESMMRFQELFEFCTISCPEGCTAEHEHIVGCKQEHKHKNLNMGVLRALLWACMVQEDESLSEREVGSLLSLQRLDVLMDAVTQLFSGAMPETEKDEGQPRPLRHKPTKPSTG